jgi:hypothetical protein
VRRAELYSPAPSPRSSPGPELEDLVRARFHHDYTFTTITQNDVDAPDAGKSDDEVELRLFATPLNAAPTVHKIRLSSPGANGKPGFLFKKPRSYYFTEHPSAADAANLRAAAVDAKTIVELSRASWPGCALPWKVHKISAAGMKRSVLVPHAQVTVAAADTVPKRTRIGKKSRMTLRKKLAAIKVKGEDEARRTSEKEEAARAKKIRLNREKKLKRKAKKQAKRTDGTAGGEGTIDEAGSDESMQA